MIPILIFESTPYLCHEYRLQENTSTTEALLLREREQNNATMKAQAETQEINLQLLNKLEDVETKIGLLQGSVQRYS
jgi:myosin V